MTVKVPLKNFSRSIVNGKEFGGFAVSALRGLSLWWIDSIGLR